MDEQSLQKKEINEKLQRVRGTRIFAVFLSQSTIMSIQSNGSASGPMTLTANDP